MQNSVFTLRAPGEGRRRWGAWVQCMFLGPTQADLAGEGVAWDLCFLGECGRWS